MSTRAVRTTGGVHWPELDGLRAAAILLVLARHSLRPVLPHDTYAPVVTLGPFDVTAALSGSSAPRASCRRTGPAWRSSRCC
jgi:peptidoglycan/LPS O-acetylase OafA/YrhL